MTFISAVKVRIFSGDIASGQRVILCFRAFTNDFGFIFEKKAFLLLKNQLISVPLHKSKQYIEMVVEEYIKYADSILNTLPDGIIIMSAWGQVLQVNLQAQTGLHLNVSSDYFSKGINIKDVLELVHKDENILPDVLEAMRQGSQDLVLPVNTSIVEKHSNTLFPVKGRFCHLDKDNFEDGLIFYFRNITSELTQEYILNTALKRTRIYPWFFDLDRKIFSLDARYFEYLGIEPDSGNTLSMDRYLSMIHPEDVQALVDAFSVQFSGDTIYDKAVPFRLRRGDGTWEWFEGQSTYIGKLSGLPFRLVGICMSIQEHKDIEATLIAARVKAEESDRLKSAFIANMSHEIRTPLNAIVGFSDVLSSTFEELSNQERKEFAHLIDSNSGQLLRLVNDVLDLSTMEANAMQFTFAPCNLSLLMEEVLKEQNITIKEGIKVNLTPSEEDLCIVTDGARLKQVICNLLNNARKFTVDGHIRFGYKKVNDKVEIFVEDTGEGIPDEHLGHIFERFYKVNSFKQGTGLGLSICRTIVERLSGTISVTSKLGKGTCFLVTLPLTN